MTRRRLLSVLSLTILIAIAAVAWNRLTALTSYLRPSFVSTTPPVSPATMTPQIRPIVVVGSGLAGLTAAYTALASGASKVYMLERAAKPGGNSIKASSGINGANTRFQAAAHHGLVDDTFYDDTIKSAALRGDQNEGPQRKALIKTLTQYSAEAIDFLSCLGVDLSVVVQLGGHSQPRTHRGAGKTPPGAAIVTTLLKKLQEEESRFELLTQCEVTKLLTASDEKDPWGQMDWSHPHPSGISPPNPAGQDPPVVVGVEFRRLKDGTLDELRGPVIFTTGGFAGDTLGLLAQYRPDLSGMPSTNEPRPSTHRILSDVGAKLVDMERVQIHPTGFVDPANPNAQLKFLAAEMLRGEGGIVVRGDDGTRFVNELETREHVSKAIMDLPPSAVEDTDIRQWKVELILDEGVKEAAASHVGFYMWKGLLQKKKVSELSAELKKTLSSYAAIVKGEKNDDLGRTVFGHWQLGVETPIKDDDEVYIGHVTPITHFTMGGALINEQAQVLVSDLGQDPKPILGLWAAGEITGGLHGDNRLGGSSLLECVVFGKIAGLHAHVYDIEQPASKLD
ncbi:FAD binding domain-containing protein [Podospora didyma]|uniref:FAD binding domain-containing protein n=1 Tax=Podospora didyma TaxID=330526 RepID=A0AAE0K0Q4_9PEZI|nr:FAD binding domain-containing protein [Podospora didyma]